VRTLETFQGTYILGASRGRLCDSSAVLFMLITAAATANSLPSSLSVVFIFGARIFNPKASLKNLRKKSEPEFGVDLWRQLLDVTRGVCTLPLI